MDQGLYLLQMSITFPTISSISPSVIENTATNVVITGTNSLKTVQHHLLLMQSIHLLVRYTANSVTFTSATSVTANFTLPVDGTYFLRLENNDGIACRSGSCIIDCI